MYVLQLKKDVDCAKKMSFKFKKDTKYFAPKIRGTCDVLGELGTQRVVILFSSTYNSVRIRRNALLFWLFQYFLLCLWKDHGGTATR